MQRNAEQTLIPLMLQLPRIPRLQLHYAIFEWAVKQIAKNFGVGWRQWQFKREPSASPGIGASAAHHFAKQKNA
jgi:hypothetical protein